MKYNEETYRKVFPLDESSHEEIETAVEGFNPTETETDNETAGEPENEEV